METVRLSAPVQLKAKLAQVIVVDVLNDYLLQLYRVNVFHRTCWA